MKRELEEVARSFRTIATAKERGIDLDLLETYYVQKRVNIVDTIGRKKRVRH